MSEICIQGCQWKRGFVGSVFSLFIKLMGMKFVYMFCRMELPRSEGEIYFDRDDGN